MPGSGVFFGSIVWPFTYSKKRYCCDYVIHCEGGRERERERETIGNANQKRELFVFVFSWLYKASRAMKAAKKVAARTRTEDGALSGDAVPVQMREGPAEPATTAMPDGGLVWQLSPPELVPDEQLS